MINEESGNVAYVVMTFGGLLGLGGEQHVSPWRKLAYDKSRSEFTTDISEEDVKGATGWPADCHVDRDWEKRTHDHFCMPIYWGVTGL